MSFISAPLHRSRTTTDWDVDKPWRTIRRWDALPDEQQRPISYVVSWPLPNSYSVWSMYITARTTSWISGELSALGRGPVRQGRSLTKTLLIICSLLRRVGITQLVRWGRGVLFRYKYRMDFVIFIYVHGTFDSLFKDVQTCCFRCKNTDHAIANADNKAIDSKWIHVDIQKSLDTLYEEIHKR